ncbi:hypothetical protein X793_05270 [Dehalococcoides mccartyi CG4]|nr:hypothetical protein X793_05270 [Dehalococcoides mccartyi CG4]
MSGGKSKPAKRPDSGTALPVTKERAGAELKIISPLLYSGGGIFYGERE